MLLVKGTRGDREYDLSDPLTTQLEADSIKRREETNGYYSSVRVFDLDAYQEDEYRKLPPEELNRLAGIGDPVARAVLSLPVAGPSEDEIRAQIAALQSQLPDERPEEVPASPFVAAESKPARPTSKKGE